MRSASTHFSNQAESKCNLNPVFKACFWFPDQILSSHALTSYFSAQLFTLQSPASRGGQQEALIWITYCCGGSGYEGRKHLSHLTPPWRMAVFQLGGWVLQRPAHALVHMISIICPCLLQDSAAKEDSALLVLWKSSSSLILIAQILKRLQHQWYHRKTKSCIWIPTMYMRCMCLYFAVPTKTEALPSFTNKTVHY